MLYSENSRGELLDIKSRFTKYLDSIKGLNSQQIYSHMYNTMKAEKEVISSFTTVTEDYWDSELHHSKDNSFIIDEIKSVIVEINYRLEKMI